jgi:hypothetical protein
MDSEQVPARTFTRFADTFTPENRPALARCQVLPLFRYVADRPGRENRRWSVRGTEPYQ